MPILTLDIEVDYALIAIHSSEEDYRLAFLFNSYLNTKFKRYKHCLDFGNSAGEFPLFEFKNEAAYLNYFLINNKHISVNQKNIQSGFFDGDYSITSYLIPERKKVDYFLKIEGCCNDGFLSDLTKAINKIPKVITSYRVDTYELKSKDHLIF